MMMMMMMMMVFSHFWTLRIVCVRNLNPIVTDHELISLPDPTE
jgi:hypothetical protein